MTDEKLIDDIKNNISFALKDPTLQQGFEIVCNNLAKLEKENAELKKENAIFKKALKLATSCLEQSIKESLSKIC